MLVFLGLLYVLSVLVSFQTNRIQECVLFYNIRILRLQKIPFFVFP